MSQWDDWMRDSSPEHIIESRTLHLSELRKRIAGYTAEIQLCEREIAEAKANIESAKQIASLVKCP